MNRLLRTSKNMKYQYFIASRYRNREMVLDLANKLRSKGRTVYCFIESDASIKNVGGLNASPEEAMKAFESIPDWTKNPAVKEVFETDMAALKASENIILLLPAGKSAHMEAGVAYGLGKNLILIGDQKETESLYLVFNESYPSIGSFIASLA